MTNAVIRLPLGALRTPRLMTALPATHLDEKRARKFDLNAKIGCAPTRNPSTVLGRPECSIGLTVAFTAIRPRPPGAFRAARLLTALATT